MGLDIYFEIYENRPMVKKAEASYNKWTEGLILDHPFASRLGTNILRLNDDQRRVLQTHRDFVSMAVGLKTNGYFSPESLRLPSVKYPEHLFKIGYFRSSYNESGTNRVLKNCIEKDLYWIFQYKEEEQEFQIDWKKGRERADQALTELKAFTDRYGSLFQINAIDFPTNSGTQPKDNREALLAVTNAIDNNRGEFDRAKEKEPALDFLSFSNRDGYFNISPRKEGPLPVCAQIPGFYRDKPVVYIVNRTEASWYIEALEIVLESFDHVLSLPQKEQKKIWIGWCG